jgi:phosphoglycerate dehydrogenase-like enzyme
MSKIIQITNTYKGAVLDIVRSCVPEGFEIRTLPENTQEALMACVPEADYILASGRVKLDRQVLACAGRLRMIQRTGVGLDSLDLDAIRERGIPLYVNQGVNSQSVAEHTILLILACLKKLCLIDRNTKNGVWQKQAQGVTTFELAGKTVGIVGMGHIGQRVAHILNSFGAKILYYAPSRQPETLERELGAVYTPLDELLSRSDVVTLHCPLTEQTRGMICQESLASMKDGVIIVNTARGGLVDEAALLEAIDSGHVAFAGLDVHGEEPIPAGNRLVMSDHVIATPHIGGVSYDAFHRMMSEAMRNIRCFDQGQLEQIAEMEYRHGK